MNKSKEGDKMGKWEELKVGGIKKGEDREKIKEWWVKEGEDREEIKEGRGKEGG